MAGRSHSKFCRERIAQELDKTENGRRTLKNVEERPHVNDEDVEMEDGLELFALDHVDAHVGIDRGIGNQTKEVQDSESDGQSDGDCGGGALAWINRITPIGCTLGEVRELLKKLDSHLKVPHGNTGNGRKATDNDISGMYSPPRVVARASRHGLRPRFSLDFTTCTPDGEPWGCNHPHMRKRAIEEFNGHQPGMPILSPTCGPLSQLQGLNYSKLEFEKVEEKLRERCDAFKVLHDIV